MPVAVPLTPGRQPRRARYLVPLGTPRRSEILAVLAVAAVAAGALLAPVTLALAVAFYAVSRVSRWRPVWLAVPACCGFIWLLAAGPGAAVAGFTAVPDSVAALLSSLVTDPAALTKLPAAEIHGLTGQLPVALILAAAAAALACWVRWLHTDEWDLPAVRPGLVSRCRRRLTAASVRHGGVVTRDGACLGVDRVTGRPAALSWRDAGGGVLVTGAAEPAVLASGLQLGHAAIRRRRPVIVVDLAGSRELPGALAAVCAAAAAPLQVFGADGAVRYQPGQVPAEHELAVLQTSPLSRWLGPGPATSARISLAEVVRRRAVVLFSLDHRRYGRAAEMIATLVAADTASVYATLARKGVRSEGLCWFTECDGVDAGALAGLIAPGGQTELALVLATTGPQTAARLAGHVGAAVVHRLADRDLAAEFAALTGTRLMPIARVPAQQAAAEHGAGTWAPAGSAVPLGTVPVPVVSANALCELGDDEFVLVTGLTAARAGRRTGGGLAGGGLAGLTGGASGNGHRPSAECTGPVVTVLARCQAIAGQIPAPIPAQLPARREPRSGAPPVPGRRA